MPRRTRDIIMAMVDEGFEVDRKSKFNSHQFGFLLSGF